MSRYWKSRGHSIWIRREIAVWASGRGPDRIQPAPAGTALPAYQSYFIANLRMVLDVEVQPGNQTASSFAQPELWALLDGLDQSSRPTLVRGDCPWGTERAMEGAEQRSIP